MLVFSYPLWKKSSLPCCISKILKAAANVMLYIVGLFLSYRESRFRKESGAAMDVLRNLDIENVQ
jgi:hypothetical protein